VKIFCENQRRIRVISVLIFIRIGELPLGLIDPKRKRPCLAMAGRGGRPWF